VVVQQRQSTVSAQLARPLISSLVISWLPYIPELSVRLSIGERSHGGTMALTVKSASSPGAGCSPSKHDHDFQSPRSQAEHWSLAVHRWALSLEIIFGNL